MVGKYWHWYGGPWHSEEDEIRKQNDIEAKKKELSATNDRELSDLVTSVFKRQPMNRLAEAYLLSIGLAPYVIGILIPFIPAHESLTGKILYASGLLAGVSLYGFGLWKAKKYTLSYGDDIRNEALIDLFAERHNIKYSEVKKHLFSKNTFGQISL